MKHISFLLFFFISYSAFSQTSLTVEKIMQDPKWIGTSPSDPYWSADGQYLFFSWNPEKNDADSIYYITPGDRVPKKASYALRNSVARAGGVTYNKAGTIYTFSKNGDIFYTNVKTGQEKRITRTNDNESSPVFINNDASIAYLRSQDVFAFELNTGTTVQLTNFERGTAPRKPELNELEAWLQQDQMQLSQVVRARKEKREEREAARKQNEKEQVKTIYTGDRNISGLTVSPSGRYITYRLVNSSQGRNTIVPDYVAESGFTTNLNARPKVGSPENTSKFYVFDRQSDSVIAVSTINIPGIRDEPDYMKDYSYDSARKRNQVREVTIYGPFWNPGGSRAIVDVRSHDNKDRWIMLLEPASGNLKPLDRQRDEAWIGGPGINSLFSQEPWINDETFWFQSEASGYSHLYSYNFQEGKKKALTSGNFEVLSARLSADKKFFYLSTNEVHPGEQHFYRMPSGGGNRMLLTSGTGAHQVTVSPDEKYLAVLHSYSNRPWELYLRENRTGGKSWQITSLAQSSEFASYPWRDPELVSFKARDGASVPARLYKPDRPHPSRPAVIFVHGAGYLQNVHKWWSSYFREYMFHNLLADLGYTVLDIDYRGSAGYGRDWRTAIYRHMGGKDLDDQLDGAAYLASTHNVNAERIGIYGGSYGGFITLMALFKEPGVFAAGAALRSVTDWAHYNHPYTSNILNEPFNDSIAYRRSSPIYYAEGLQDPLLMCHGMVDVNVHFQDIVRLTQRLIELKKENWELAVYPVEDHAFSEPTSWMDEYKRILKLFETHLKK